MENVACHFVFYTGPRKGDAETFRTARITIGKAANNDFRLDPTADQVSQHHAEILLENDVYLLYDLGSKAGTYVNGERVHERCVLMNEDYVRFSQDGPEIIFRLGVGIPGKQKLPLVFPVTAEMEFISGSDAGRIFPINAAITTNIGRRADLEIPLDPRGDMIVSGNHCNVRYLDGHFVLMDTSRNGTYVNGDLVEQPMEIIDGDVIMLGDGGPQARFRVDLAKRHYPNHRPLSPVNKPAKPAAPSVSAMKSEPKPAPATPAPKAEPTEPEKPLASAAPFATGSAPMAAQAAAAAAAGAGAEAMAETVEQSFVEDAVMPAGATAADLAGDESDDDDEIPSTRAHKAHVSTAAMPGAGEASALPDAAASTRKSAPGLKQRVSAVVPPLHKLKFQPGRNLIIGAVALVVLIGIIMMFSGRGEKSELDDIPMQTLEGTGFTVKVPEGWPTSKDGGKVNAEPPDKRLALDYSRDPRLNEERFERMLLSSGATRMGEPRVIKTDDGTVKVMEATLGNYHRYAALHLPAKGPAMVAQLETTEENAKRLTKEDIDRYIVSNVELKPMEGSPAPATPPAPAPTAKAEAALPTPSTTPAAPEPTQVAKAPEPTAAPSATPEATNAAAAPTPAATATADDKASDSANMQKVQSKVLKMTVAVPKQWKAVSEEADGMLTIADGTGLEIRIARDPGDLDPEATFKAMKEEGWKQDGLMTEDARFKAGEFSKSDQNLLLILVPEKAKTTVVLYATAKSDFTEEQRRHIQQVMVQLLP